MRNHQDESEGFASSITWGTNNLNPYPAKLNHLFFQPI